MYSRQTRQVQNRGDSVHAALTGFNDKAWQGHPANGGARGSGDPRSNSHATQQHNNYTGYSVNPSPAQAPAGQWPSHDSAPSSHRAEPQQQQQQWQQGQHYPPQGQQQASSKASPAQAPPTEVPRHTYEAHPAHAGAHAPPHQHPSGGGPTLIRHFANAGMVHQPDSMQTRPPQHSDTASVGGGSAMGGQRGVPFLPGFSGGDGPARESFGINAVSHRGRPAVTPGTLPSAHDKHARGWIRYHLPEEHRPGIRPTNTSIALQQTTAATMAAFGGATSPEHRPGTAPSAGAGGRLAPNPGRKLQSSEQTANALAWGDNPAHGAPVEQLQDDVGTAVRPRRAYVHKNLTSNHVANSLRYEAAREGGRDGYDPEHSVRPRTAFVARTQRSDGVHSAITGSGDDASAGAFHGCAPVTATPQQVKGMMGGHGKRIQHYERAQRSADGILQRDGNRYFESTQAAMHTGASEGGPRARTPPRRGKRPVTQGVNNPYRQTWVFG